MILFHDWMPAAFGVAVFGLLLAFGQMEIAKNVTEPGIQMLAWLSAALAGFASMFWFILGISYFVNLVLILREAKNR
jgi:hypothetical protein